MSRANGGFKAPPKSMAGRLSENKKPAPAKKPGKKS